MDTIEFTANIPADTIATIFRDYFEQHMLAYYIVRGYLPSGTVRSIEYDKASIIYSISLLDETEKDALIRNLNSKAGILSIYGKAYKPEIYTNGDILCIRIQTN